LTEEELEEIRTTMQELAYTLRYIATTPGALDAYSPTELAWMKEQLELLVHEAREAEQHLRILMEKREN